MAMIALKRSRKDLVFTISVHGKYSNFYPFYRLNIFFRFRRLDNFEESIRANAILMLVGFSNIINECSAIDISKHPQNYQITAC